jgi:hypothetical protein
MQKGIYPTRKNIYFVGNGFNNGPNSDITEPNKVIKRHFYNYKKEYVVSQLSINYLDSITNLCNKNSIQLVMVNTPVHATYSEKIPITFRDKYNELKNKYRESGFKIFEDTINKYSDTLFRNSDHLNIYGAEKFTKELSTFIQKTK